MDTQRRAWAIAAVLIVIIAFAGVGTFYTGYAIDKNNREQNERITHERIVNNQKWCKLFDKILSQARPGPFKDAIAEIYNDTEYRCRSVVGG